MSNRSIYGAGLGVGTTWTTIINGSDLASLASGSTVLSSVADVANQTFGDLWADVEIRMTLASTTFGAQANLALWLVPLLGNGTTYGDGSLTSGATVAFQLPYPPEGVIGPQTSVATTLVAGMIRFIPLPFGSFRFALGNNLINNSAVAVPLSATAANCVVRYRTYVLNQNG